MIKYKWAAFAPLSQNYYSLDRIDGAFAFYLQKLCDYKVCILGKKCWMAPEDKFLAITLYTIDKLQNNLLAYNKFAYKETIIG